MPINSRQKGAAFERHISKFLNDLLEARGKERSVKRNLEQYQTKGMADLYFEHFAIECKRYKERKGENWPIDKWWRQAMDAAGDKYVPILIYKYDRQEIKAVIPLAYLNPELKEVMDPQKICITSFKHFLQIAEARIADLI
jgi:hypothetical protein